MPKEIKKGKKATKLEILLKEKDSTRWLNPPGPGGWKRKQIPQIEALTGTPLKFWLTLVDNESFASFPLEGGMKAKFTTFRDLIFNF